MGQVYLALSRGPSGFRKLVVLKTLKSHLRDDELPNHLLMEEARISARLSHPNLVQTYEATEFDGVPAIVLEYVEGQSLHAITRQRGNALSRSLHLTLLTKVLAGLHAAHELRDFDGTPFNLVHRDVSPHNVMVQYDGQVKVLDFGIAKTQHSQNATETGIVRGKIRYMAPEQLSRESLDRRVDVFAVGVLLWEALTGDNLWGDRSDGDVLRALLSNDIPKLPPRSDLPETLVALCHRALQAHPERRFQTAEEFRVDLEAYLVAHEGMATDQQLAEYMGRHFEEERRQTQQLVAEQIRLADGSGRPKSWGQSLRATAAHVSRPQGQHSGTMPIPRLRRWWLVAGLLGGGLLLGTSLWRWVPPLLAGGRLAGTSLPLAPTLLLCAPGNKLCGGTCVAQDRPDFGCSAHGCVRCPIANATPRCNQHDRCDIAVCYQSFDNCDGDPSNGCETNVRTDPDNCGGCGVRCPELPHAERGCGDVCTIWRCLPGFRDCDGNVENGCEQAVSNDPDNCGHCGVHCGASSVCRDGRCQ